MPIFKLGQSRVFNRVSLLEERLRPPAKTLNFPLVLMDNPAHNSILVVDDDGIILVAISETLAAEGLHVTTCNNPIDALELVKKNPYAVVMSDQRMGEMTGLELLGEVKKLQPNASRILLTGVLTLKTVIDAINKGEIFRFLAKPWMREELVATIQNALTRYQLIVERNRLTEETKALNAELAERNKTLATTLEQVREQNVRLDAAKEALARNFDHSLELCYRIINAFHPLLGKETKSGVDICQLMCSSGGISEEDQKALHIAAWLHNIGLIGISRDVLLKSRKSPEQLTLSERNLIHNHTIYGQTLAAFFDGMEYVGSVIRSHHEKWDGTGYPDGLLGDKIPWPARCLAVAIYYVESGLPRELAIEEIKNLSGRSFDPKAVELFIKATASAPLPKKVREVLFSDLKPGMVLAKGIYSPTGMLLIPSDEVLSERALAKLNEGNAIDTMTQRFLVYI
jgi:response regulator RpfG family c-di-GMP phosphodiesterase